MKPTITTKVFLTLTLLAIATISLFAQDQPSGNTLDKSRFSRISVGISLGHLVGYTDIQQYQFSRVWTKVNENQLGIALVGNYSLSNLIGIRGNLLYGTLTGVRRNVRDTVTGKVYKSHDHAKETDGIDNDGRLESQGAAHYYKTKYLFEASIQGVMNISNLAFNPKQIGKKKKFVLYGFMGHGLIWFETQNYDLIDKTVKGTIRNSGGKKYSYTKVDSGYSGKVTEAVSSLGGGMKYKLSKKIDLALEMTARKVWNDKLDGVARGAAGDYYGYTSLTVLYKIGKAGQDEALEWINPLEVMYNDIQETKAKIAGLTNDKDGDGVADIMDKDGSTPEGVKVYGDGTTVDQDRDGIADSKDADPNSSIGAKVDENGKEIDTDGDGVADGIDQEGGTAKGSLVDVHGRAINASNTTSGGGMGGGGGVAVYFPSIFFEMGSASIGSSSYDKLATIARALKANTNIKVNVTGNASQEGSDGNNMKLGQKRAQAVADHLMKNYGIGADRIVIVESKGETEPLSNKIVSVNRRVDINVK